MSLRNKETTNTSRGRSEEYEGFDRVFPLIGGHHFYQWLLLLIVAFQRGIVVFHHIGYIYLGATPGHWCSLQNEVNLTTTGWTMDQIKNISIPRNELTNKYSECIYYDLDYNQLVLQAQSSRSFPDIYTSLNFTSLETKSCTTWNYDSSIYSSTVVSQFDLVCERKHLVATIQATYMAGIFIGSLLLGAISDKILGRRKTCLLCIAIIISFGFGAAFTTSYIMFIVFRFCIAIGVAGTQSGFTLLMEYSDVSIRATLGIIVQVAFATVYMLLPLYAYFIRDWTQLQLAFSISTLPLLTFYWILPESSRWLAQNGREEEALNRLESIASKNKRPKPNRDELKRILRTSIVGQSFSSAEQEVERPNLAVRAWAGFKHFLSSYKSLVATPELRKRSFLIWFLYMSVSFTYYGISFGSPTLSNDPFIIVFLGGLMEIPGYLGVIPLVQFWGRKPSTIFTFLTAGLAYICIVFTPLEYKIFRITFAMVSKLFISGTIAIIILLAAELYPTETRSTGLGSAVLFGRFGAIAAPFVVNMKFNYEEMSIIIFGSTALLAGLISFALPETKDEELFDNVDKIEIGAVKRRKSSTGFSLSEIRNSFRMSDTNIKHN